MSDLAVVMFAVTVKYLDCMMACLIVKTSARAIVLL